MDYITQSLESTFKKVEDTMQLSIIIFTFFIVVFQNTSAPKANTELRKYEQKESEWVCEEHVEYGFFGILKNSDQPIDFSRIKSTNNKKPPNKIFKIKRFQEYQFIPVIGEFDILVETIKGKSNNKYYCKFDPLDIRRNNPEFFNMLDADNDPHNGSVFCQNHDSNFNFYIGDKTYYVEDIRSSRFYSKEELEFLKFSGIEDGDFIITRDTSIGLCNER